MTGAPDAEREAWNALIVPLAKRKEADRMPMPWEAHRLGWEAGRADLREEIADFLERQADEQMPGTVVRWPVVAAKIRAGVLTDGE